MEKEPRIRLKSLPKWGVGKPSQIFSDGQIAVHPATRGSREQLALYHYVSFILYKFRISLLGLGFHLWKGKEGKSLS
jgi:hypothetical protein